MSQLTERVAEHRDAIEAWAASDLPLADDMAALLNEVEDAKGGA